MKCGFGGCGGGRELPKYDEIRSNNGKVSYCRMSASGEK
jgi:hypothetical protein